RTLAETKQMSFSLQSLVAGLALLTATGIAQAGELTVSAATSLTNAFKEIAHDDEGLHPDATVQSHFGASRALLRQKTEDAPGDLFAAADQETMEQAARQMLIEPGSRQDFANNALVLIVPNDSTLKLAQLDDLTQSGVEKVAIGNPTSVPV